MVDHVPSPEGAAPERRDIAAPPNDQTGAATALPASAAATSTAGAGALWVFTPTVFLSALLLFSVQPMFAKMVLPVLGGAPSVWAVAMCFFQGALLAGYCYAHFLISRLPAHRSGLVHLGLTLLAFVVLPIAIPSGWGEPPPGEPYMWQLAMFAVAIGLPFVAVSANAPLLQAWFAATGHPQGRDPYFLYAASNLGSLIALLAYPLVLEPAFGVSALARFWTAGYALLLVCLGVCFWRGVVAHQRGEAPVALAPATDVAGEGGVTVPSPTSRYQMWLSTS